LKRINGVPDNATYPGIVALVKGSALGKDNSVIAKLNGFFGQGEAAISSAFNSLADEISGQGDPPINKLRGQGSTAHTLYTVQPKGGGQASSLAPQCSWGMKKLNAAASSGSAGGQHQAIAGAAAASDVDPLIEFIDGFAQRIGQDGNLS